MGDIDIYPYPEPGPGVTDIAQQAAAPPAPDIGDLWLDTDENSGVGLSSIIGYSQTTTNQASVTTEVDLVGLTVTVTVPAGRRIRITGQTLQSSTNTNTTFILRIKEGSTQLVESQVGQPSAGNGYTSIAQVILSPTAGTHTYKLTGQATSSSTVLSASWAPSFILVEDITGSLWPIGQSINVGMIASEPWISYTPTLSADTTAPTLGTGAIAQGKYTKIGRTVFGSMVFQFGTGAAAGSGYYRIALPYASPTPGTGDFIVGSAIMYDNSAGVVRTGSTSIDGNNQIFRVFHDGGGAINLVSNSAPFVWAQGDKLEFNFTYEATS